MDLNTPVRKAYTDESEKHLPMSHFEDCSNDLELADLKWSGLTLIRNGNIEVVN